MGQWFGTHNSRSVVRLDVRHDGPSNNRVNAICADFGVSVAFQRQNADSQHESREK